MNRIKEIVEEYADCREEISLDKCVAEIVAEVKRKQLEEYLWAIKEATWELYGEAFWQSGIPKTVEQICLLVDRQLKILGFDPVVRIK